MEFRQVLEKEMSSLSYTDLTRVTNQLPEVVKKLLKEYKGLYLAGGFIRSSLEGKVAKDIDMFGKKDILLNVFDYLKGLDDVEKSFSTGNAITVHFKSHPPIQLILRWEYKTPEAVINSFDFTIAQACIFVNDVGEMESHVSERFYSDFFDSKLVYTSPIREEELAGSMQRVIKFIKKGYHIDNDNLAKVIARLTKDIKKRERKKIVNGIQYEDIGCSGLTEYEIYNVTAKRLKRAQCSKY